MSNRSEWRDWLCNYYWLGWKIYLLTSLANFINQRLQKHFDSLTSAPFAILAGSLPPFISLSDFSFYGSLKICYFLAISRFLKLGIKWLRNVSNSRDLDSRGLGQGSEVGLGAAWISIVIVSGWRAHRAQWITRWKHPVPKMTAAGDGPYVRPRFDGSNRGEIQSPKIS